MAYDESLAERMRAALEGTQGVSEKKMFGGLAFLLNGNMCCGVSKDEMMLRLGAEGAEAALSEKYTRPMDFTGKPLKSMVYVQKPGFADDADLGAWVARAAAFTGSLPAK